MAEQSFSDENQSDDWETLDETGELDRQINALSKQMKKKQSNPSDNADNNHLQFGRVTILQNNEQRTQYTPTIKLLKRDPAEATAAAQANMGDRKPSYKSLQQREAEYNEARKRILGDVGEPNADMSGMELMGTNPSVPTSVLPQRSSIITTQKLESVIKRQPLGPDPTSKGFRHRAEPIDNTS